MQPGDITNKCGASDADLMTEEEWEAQQMEEKIRINRDDYVYGKYSLGSGEILSDPKKLYNDVGSPEVIESYKKQIIIDLEKSGIPLHHIPDYNIMNVGTGREAIAFNQLGAKSVQHYDLSLLNVQRMNKYIKDNALEQKLTTKYTDVVKENLPKNHFDYIYLHGIVQCFSNVGTGLLNCIGALKPNGMIWLYFYRSGSFGVFLIYMIRDLISDSKNMREYYINAILLRSNLVEPNLHVSGLMDGLFVENMHLYTPTTYISFIEECGLEVVSSSKLDPFGKDVDHRFAHPSVVLVCKKTANKDLSQVNMDLLSPANSVNQLNDYTDCDITKSINLYKHLKNVIRDKNIHPSIVMSISFRLFDLHISQYASYKETGFFNGHGALQKILTNTIQLLNDEYDNVVKE